ncbi:MAG: YbbR-like domain-containing protein [Flavobacteriales bacterium]|nr:YbbR-like domain-containing protein [Flavobacteriales bacterium]
MADINNTKNSEVQQNHKKLRIFLLFLLLATLFWSLIKLSKEYISEVEFELAYSEIPNNKLIQNEPDKKVKLTLKTVGFKLLNYEFKKRVLDYSLTEIERKSGSMYYSETRSNTNYLQAQLSAETIVLNVEPDTLFFDLGVKRSKKVPVVSQMTYQFKTGFNFVGDVTLSPTEISISGPEKVIDTIDEIYTFKDELNEISESFEYAVSLEQPNDVIVLSEEKVTVKGEVDKITDGSYTLPFKVINLPRNVIISTYPKEVKVVYQVALKDYNKIPENSFRIQCDYKQTEDNKLDYLIPKLIDKPEIITNVKIIPNKIEFLIKK